MNSNDIPSMSSDLSSQEIVINQMNELQKNKEKISLLEKQLRESQTLIENKESKNESMKRELRELKDKLIKYEIKSYDKDIEVIGRHGMSGQHNIEDMFAQIVIMNDKMCDIEIKIIDMQKKINEQKVLIEERNRTIEGLLSQQVMDSSDNLEQVVQTEEHKESVKDIGNERKVYPKDSIDRFGDDLTEEILQYLTFEDKIRLECVSKQWKRCVFQKQYIFEIDLYLINIHNSLNKLIDKDDNYHLDEEALESVLKKCPNITKVKLSDLNVKSKVMLMFGQYCPRLKSLLHNSKGVYFYRKNGHKLEELILWTDGRKKEIKTIFEFCPNLKIFFSNDKSVLFNEDKEFLPKLEQIRETFEIIREYVNKMHILSDKYSQTMKRLNLKLDEMTAKELKTCIECIARFENLKELKLDFYSHQNIGQPIDDCLTLIGRKCTKLVKLDLCIYGSVPISDRFFTAFCELKAIKKLKISLPHNTVLSGSVECFKHCTELYELDITYDKLTEDFFANIQLFVPKLQSLRIETCQQFSDSFINSFHSMKNIERVIIFKRNVFNHKKYYYFGKCLTEVMLSPGLNVIRVNDNCGFVYYN